MCGPEKWPGECSQGLALDGGVGDGRIAQSPPLLDAGPSTDAVSPPGHLSPDGSSMPSMPVDGGGACSDMCRLDDGVCVDGSRRRCVVLPGGCTGWSEPMICPAPQTCPAGRSDCGCVPDNACTEIGSKRCSAAGLQTCVMNGSCREWGAAIACQAPRLCEASPGGGACVCPSGSGLTSCESACVNLTSDSKNCGACGRDCLGGVCQNGACQPKQVTASPLSAGDWRLARIACTSSIRRGLAGSGDL